MNLMEQIASFSNLSDAFRECARGKRGSIGYQRGMFANGEKLLRMQERLLAGTYVWGCYREFVVRDPKARLVMAAPFMDRVVHTAIHRVLDPLIDHQLYNRIYACRKGKGTRNAIIDLFVTLRAIGQERFVMKLDVRKYFASIHHEILMKKLSEILPDQSLTNFLWSLLRNYPEYASARRGIPIGNLTSQLFANFYLMSADRIAVNALKDNGSRSGNGFYFRYMDDMILGGSSKKIVMDATHATITHVKDELSLDIPYQKQMPIGNAPVPFLGFLLDHTGYKILSRNRGRFEKTLRRLVHNGERPSLIAQVARSHEAWRDLNLVFGRQ